METKNILSRKDAGLLEEVILKYGRIVDFKLISKIFKKEYSLAELKNRLSKLAKIGWLLRIKKGLYVIITDLANLNSNDISSYTLCQVLNKDSYISFENALQFHGMFDQMLSTVNAVTFKRARKYKIQNTEIKYFKIKKELYFGFVKEKSDIGLVNIARKEKAILDILYYRSNEYYIGLVWEKLNEYKNDFDFILLKKYTKKFGLNIIRQIGFFLDKLSIDTQDLIQLVENNTSYSKMTKKSNQFNSKWRLYYDNRIIE